MARRKLVFDAVDAINFVGSRTRQHDSAMFAEFRDPGVLTPGWSPNGTGRWHGLSAAAPEDPAARLLWVVSEAVAPAGPWLPTLAEQDERWWAVFGERAERQARARRDAISVGARGPGWS